jgi:predicted acylesterase/phospholipase RssA
MTSKTRPRPPIQCVALLLQGGGALGAYQAGVYEALTEADLHPDWIAGISIGAINGALIAGNAPEARVDKLRASIAFIFGLVPLVTAHGAAQISRRAVGTPVFAGMIGASVVGIFVIPMLYVTFQTMREWRPKGRAPAIKDGA